MERYPIPCTPPLWARGGHPQTILAHLLPSRAPRLESVAGTASREIALPDGDRLVAWTRPGTSGVRVILMHGLSGDANADYMRRAAAALSAEGHGIWAVNHRGCGEGAGLAREPYHSGKTEDLSAILEASRREAPELRQVVVGFSLSANLALLHAARHESPPADGIVAVNPPVDIEATSVAIGRGLSRVYERRFLWRIRRAVAERQAAGLTKGTYDLPWSLSLLEFDDRFTAPECGFENGLDYYRRCSSLPRLPAVETPSVLITSEDDPFVDPASLRVAPRSPHVFLHLEPSGGHVGYLARGAGARPWNRWLDGALVHYVRQLTTA